MGEVVPRLGNQPGGSVPGSWLLTDQGCSVVSSWSDLHKWLFHLEALPWSWVLAPFRGANLIDPLSSPWGPFSSRSGGWRVRLFPRFRTRLTLHGLCSALFPAIQGLLIRLGACRVERATRSCGRMRLNYLRRSTSRQEPVMSLNFLSTGAFGIR